MPAKISKRWWIGGVLVILVTVFAMLSGDKDQHLKLSVTAAGLRIVNVDSASVKIRDVVINGRDDCSTLRLVDPAFSKDLVHKTWVANGVVTFYEEKDGKLMGLGTGKALTTEPRVLRTGDEAYWRPSCDSQIVSATVTTDAGTATYTFR